MRSDPHARLGVHRASSGQEERLRHVSGGTALNVAVWKGSLDRSDRALFRRFLRKPAGAGVTGQHVIPSDDADPVGPLLPGSGEFVDDEWMSLG